MTSSVFVDTNVLVYLFERDLEDPRTEAAQRVIEPLMRQGRVSISAQVVTEFINVLTRKLEEEVTGAEILRSAEDVVEACTVVALDEYSCRAALRAADRYRMGYLDAQIWAAAWCSGCSVILTEDTHGEQIEGVAYVNPLLPGFDVEALTG